MEQQPKRPKISHEIKDVDIRQIYESNPGGTFILLILICTKYNVYIQNLTYSHMNGGVYPIFVYICRICQYLCQILARSGFLQETLYTRFSTSQVKSESIAGSKRGENCFTSTLKQLPRCGYVDSYCEEYEKPRDRRPERRCYGRANRAAARFEQNTKKNRSSERTSGTLLVSVSPTQVQFSMIYAFFIAFICVVMYLLLPISSSYLIALSFIQAVCDEDRLDVLTETLKIQLRHKGDRSRRYVIAIYGR